ncbi:MAG: copper chaperone PCu(A)C [Nitriliruptoraceae bacterium]
MPFRRSVVASAVLLLALIVAGCGPNGTPELHVGTVQAADPIAGSSQVVLSITNDGDADDTLLAVETDAAVAIELHETRIEDGQATMERLDEVPLPAGETVRFQPGGLHLMMVGPDDEVELGATFDITLEFDRSEAITATAEVRELLDLAEGSDHDSDH